MAPTTLIPLSSNVTPVSLFFINASMTPTADITAKRMFKTSPVSHVMYPGYTHAVTTKAAIRFNTA